MIGYVKDAVAVCFYLAKPLLRRAGREITLVYHAVEEAPPSQDPLKMSVAPELFARQMSDLARRKVPAVVTFDDGYESVYRNAFPVLRQFGIQVKLFLTTGFIDREVSMEAAFGGGRSPSPLTWEQIQEMASWGAELGSHAVTHRNMARLDPALMEREAADSRRRIEERTGKQVRAFSYPFGNTGAFTASTEEALRRAGYTSAYINRMETGGAPQPFRIPRTRVYRTDSLFRFRLKTAGAYNWVDSLR